MDIKVLFGITVFLAVALLFAGCTGQGETTGAPSGGQPSGNTSSAINVSTGGATGGATGETPSGGAGETGGETGGTGEQPSGDNGTSDTGAGEQPSDGNENETGAAEEQPPADEGPAALVGANEFQAVYDTIVVDSSSTAGSQEGAMAIYNKGENMRVDVNTAGMTIQAFTLGSKSYTCMQLPETTGITCMESQESEASSVSDVSTIETHDPVYTGKETISGYISDCYTMAIDSTESKACVSGGVLTYSETTYQTAKSTITIKAGSLSTTVSDSVFVLPAQPTAAPGY